MKKCLFTLLVCLFAGAVSFSLMAQEPYNGSVSTKTNSYYWTYVVCDGELVDGVHGMVEMHKVAHYKKGVLEWTKYTFTGEGESWMTGEAYTLKSHDKENLPVEGLYTWTVHLKSEEGDHYKCSFTWDMVSGIITADKAWCK